MRFLFEAANYTNLLSAKQDLEQQKNISYDRLDRDHRREFIANCLDQLKNSRSLKPAYPEIIDSILDSEWNDRGFIRYIENIKENIVIPGEVIKLVYNLMHSNKIDYTKSSKWLEDRDLYDRNLSDTLYSIKALTLADNEALQQDSKGNNRYFDDDNPLVVNDFYIDGKLAPAAQIEDILNSKQTKNVDFGEKQTYSDIKAKLKMLADKNNQDVDVDAETLKLDSKIKAELESMLSALGVKSREANNLIDSAFERGASAEELLRKILRGMQ